MICLGFLLFAILFVLSVALGGLNKLVLFWDMPTIMFALLGPLGYTLLFGRKEIIRGIETFFAFSFQPDDEAGRFFQRLTTFTVRWGLFGMLLALVLTMMDLDPDTVGAGIAVSLLSVLYTSALAGFVFLPIGLRLSPSDTQSSLLKMTVNLSLTGLAVFVLLVCIRVLADFGYFHADISYFLNPAIIFLYWDVPSLVFVVGGWWAFRLASGKRRKWIAAPVIIMIGIFGSMIGFVLMLSDLDPDTFGVGFAVSLITTLYGFIGAAGFLIADMRSSFKEPPSSPPADGTEQAKAIIDRAVEDVQKGKR